MTTIPWSDGRDAPRILSDGLTDCEARGVRSGWPEGPYAEWSEIRRSRLLSGSVLQSDSFEVSDLSTWWCYLRDVLLEVTWSLVRENGEWRMKTVSMNVHKVLEIILLPLFSLLSLFVFVSHQIACWSVQTYPWTSRVYNFGQSIHVCRSSSIKR